MVEICTVDKNKASRAGPPSDPIPATWASYPTSLNLKFLIFKKKKKKHTGIIKIVLIPSGNCGHHSDERV